MEQRAVQQDLHGRGVVEDRVEEAGEVLPGLLGPPALPAVPHPQQLGAQVVQPQHVGVGLVGAPLVAAGRQDGAHVTVMIWTVCLAG